MTSAKNPSGPGKLINARRDAATQAEELDELKGEAPPGESTAPPDSSRDARHAERGAHVSSHSRASVGNPNLSHGTGRR